MPYSKPTPRSEAERKAFKHWLGHPVEAVKDWFKVTPDPWQGDLLNGLFVDKDRVAIKSAHGTGKSCVDAWAGWIFLNCYENSRLVATAPTIHQLKDVLFPEFAKWHARMPQRMRDEWTLSAEHIRHKDTSDGKQLSQTWFATARTSNKPENLQGFHNENLLILGDEGSAIADNVFEVIEGAMSEAGDEGKVAKLVITGNPNFAQGELYRAFTKNSDLYHCITVTGDPDWFASLGIEQGDFVPLHGRVYYSPRVKQKYRDTMAKKYGKDSAIYDVRVRGIFPKSADDVIIPWEWAERARGATCPVTFSPFDGVTLVVDPQRGGVNETVVGVFRKGYCVEMQAKNCRTTPEVVNMVDDAVKKLIAKKLNLVEIIVDEPGVGGGVIDDLRKLNLPVRPYNGGWGLRQGVDPADDIRQFKNRRARDCWHVRRLLEAGVLPLPDDEVLIAQATSLKYHYSTDEKIVCESKEDLKDRLGKDASPDRFDVIVMGTAPWYEAAAVHANLTEEDVIEGADRPAYEDMDGTPDDGWGV